MIRDGELNGPRRYIWRNNIVTGTYKDGELHGLYMQVASDFIYVQVYREGRFIFRLKFTPSGEETYRTGSEKNSFSDVDASTFLK